MKQERATKSCSRDLKGRIFKRIWSHWHYVNHRSESGTEIKIHAAHFIVKSAQSVKKLLCFVEAECSLLYSELPPPAIPSWATRIHLNLPHFFQNSFATKKLSPLKSTCILINVLSQLRGKNGQQNSSFKNNARRKGQMFALLRYYTAQTGSFTDVTGPFFKGQTVRTRETLVVPKGRWLTVSTS
jgi:hypothetical protein